MLNQIYISTQSVLANIYSVIKTHLNCVDNIKSPYEDYQIFVHFTYQMLNPNVSDLICSPIYAISSAQSSDKTQLVFTSFFNDELFGSNE